MPRRKSPRGSKDIDYSEKADSGSDFHFDTIFGLSPRQHENTHSDPLEALQVSEEQLMEEIRLQEAKNRVSCLTKRLSELKIEGQIKVKGLKGKGKKMSSSSDDSESSSSSDSEDEVIDKRYKGKGARASRRGSSKTSRKVPVISSSSSEDEPRAKVKNLVTLPGLKKKKRLRREAERRLVSVLSSVDEQGGSRRGKSGKHHMHVSSDSSTSSSDSSTDSSPKKSKKKMKSGLTAKSSDRVKYPQIYPHTSLQYEFVSANVEFKHLDFRQFVAGELEIIQGNVKDITRKERAGRLALLTKITYYNTGQNFKVLLDWYAAWVRRIELGRNSWADDPSIIEMAFLNRVQAQPSQRGKKEVRPSGKKAKDGNRTLSGTLYCMKYNNGECSSRAPHMATVGNTERLVSHVCASCLLDDKVEAFHPKGSADCPHRA